MPASDECIAAVIPTSQVSAADEAVPSAVQQVLAAVATASQNSQAPMPSVLPNPLHQLLLSAVPLQQRNSLAAPGNTIDENKIKRKRKEPGPNSTTRPSSNLTTARNLFSTDWCKQNKGGTRGEFTMPWDTIEKNNDPLVEVSFPVLDTSIGI